jgi:hypothetical protein
LIKSLFGLALLLGLAVGCAPKPAAKAAPAKSAKFGRVDTPPDTKDYLKAPTGRQSEVLAVQAGVAGDRISSLFELPEAECAIVIARATSSVDDVDLFAYGEDGAVLGSDESSDKTPSLLICPPHPRRIFLAARIAAGHGLVAIGAERVPLEDAERAAAAYGVRYRPGEIARRLSVWPELEERLEQHRRNIGAAWIDVRRVAVPLDARTPTRVSASIDRERCLDALILPSDEVASLDVSVLDADGRILGRADAFGRDRFAIVCSPTETTLTLELRPRSGVGLAVVMLSRSQEGSEHDLDPRALKREVYPSRSVGEERTLLAGRLATQGYGPPRLLGSGTLPLGRRVSRVLDLLPGCSRLDLVAGAPLRGVRAWVYSESGALIASGDGASPSLFVCGKAGRVRVDAEALSRPGPFAIEVRHEREIPKVLLEQPLAASRLLSRMIERGVIANPRRVGAVYEHKLSSTALERRTLMVPAGRCLDLTLATSEGGSGVELRLLDQATLEELALGRGAAATQARACATGEKGGGTLNAVAEMRVSAGTAVGLLTAHLIDAR